jgi:F-type H+-transporting ATPase subunit delta
VPDRRRAWARALFLAAPSPQSRRACAEALEGFRAAMAADKRLANFLSDPPVAKASKVQVLRAAYAGDAEGAGVFERFCSLIVDKGRISLLPQIATSYGEFRDADEGIARLEVEAARAVGDEALERIAAAWTKYSGARTTRASVRVTPALIAGYRLRAGSLRIDYSIAGRLERLGREFARPLGKTSGSPGAPGGAARGEG